MIVPHFMLKRIYRAGSLRNLPEGVAFDLKNAVGPGWLTSLVRIRLNETDYDAVSIELRADATTIAASAVTPDNPLNILMNQVVTCVVKGASLPTGNHQVTIEVKTKEAGQVSVSVQDTVEETA